MLKSPLELVQTVTDSLRVVILGYPNDPKGMNVCLHPFGPLMEKNWNY
jgi:hypothetical protein